LQVILEGIEMIYTTCMNELVEERGSSRKGTEREREKHTFLGLLAKIKCSICSYQFNI